VTDVDVDVVVSGAGTSSNALDVSVWLVSVLLDVVSDPTAEEVVVDGVAVAEAVGEYTVGEELVVE
jgi:hypothetical protein